MVEDNEKRIEGEGEEVAAYRIATLAPLAPRRPNCHCHQSRCGRVEHTPRVECSKCPAAPSATMSVADADSQDVIKALKAQQQVNGVASPPAAANGNGVHHDDGDETDGGSASKTRREEKAAISELKEAVLADESFSSENVALTKKMEAAVSVLDEALTAAEDAESKEKEAVSALEEAVLSNGDTTSVREEATEAEKEAAAKDMKAETALDEAVLAVGEAVIKNLDRVVSAVDDVAAPAPATESSKPEPVISAPTVEVTPAPQQEE